MKKGAMLLIGCIIFAMTAVIAFFGVQPENILTPVYITAVSIEASDTSSIPYDDDLGSKFQKIEYLFDGTTYQDGDKTRNAMQYGYNTAILPENATKRTYLYSVDLADQFVKTASASKGVFLFLEPDWEATSEVELYHIVTITCIANDGGPAKIQDKVELVLHFAKGS